MKNDRRKNTLKLLLMILTHPPTFTYYHTFSFIFGSNLKKKLQTPINHKMFVRPVRCARFMQGPFLFH